MMQLTLPYPPSANRYYRNVGRRTLISREGRAFRDKVRSILPAGPALHDRLAVYVEVFPPDRRRRDLDNTQKALLDALQYGGVYHDDSQIDLLHIERREVIKGGKVVVHIEKL
jgi:crossover junction endodeoxyribonuclease RusA